MEIPAHISLHPWFLNDSNDLCCAPLRWQKFLPLDCVFTCQFLNSGIMLPLVSPYHHPHIQLPAFQQGARSALLVCFLLARHSTPTGFSYQPRLWLDPFLSVQVWPHSFRYCSPDNFSHTWLGYIKASGTSGIFSGKE